MYEPDTGPVGVCTTVDYNLDMREYEDIDNPRPNHISQPSDLRIKDYSQPRDALIHAGYEIPPWVCAYLIHWCTIIMSLISLIYILCRI